MLLRLNKFSGEVPRLDPTQLPDSAAQYSLNCDFTAGDLRGLKDGSSALLGPTTVKGMHVTNAGRWYSWPYDIDSVDSPIVDDQYQRFYWTDGSSMWVARGDTGGYGYQPGTKYLAGVPTPAQPPMNAGELSIYPTGVSGYQFKAYCVRDGQYTQINDVYATEVVDPGRTYRMTLTGTCTETTVVAGNRFVVGSANGIYGYLGSQYSVYAATSATSPLTGAVYIDAPAGSDLAKATEASMEVYDANGASAVRRFYRLGATTEFCTTQGAASLLTTTETTAGEIAFELLIGNMAGEYGSGGWKVTVPKTGSTSLPADIAGGVWQVSVQQETGGTYLFSISPGTYVETRAYVYTYVNQWGEESGPSQATIIDVTPGIGHMLNLLCPLATSHVPITKFRLYRSNTGSQATDYQFVADFGVGALDGSWQMVMDTVASADLGEVLPTLGYTTPPEGATGLKMMGNGIATLFVGNELWLSEPYLPYVFKQSNTMSFPNAIKGIQPYEQSLFVTTTANPWLVNGVSPDAMSQAMLPEIQAGVNKNAITQVNNTVVYLSHDGIVVARGLDTTLTQSQSLFTRRTWRERYAANLSYARLTAHDGMVLCSFDNGVADGFVLRLDETPGLTRTNEGVLATTIWPENDWMYYSVGSQIKAFGGSPSTKAWTWQSKDFLLNKPHNFGCYQAAGAGSVTFKFYCDAVLKHTATKTLTTAPVTYRLPSGFVAGRWSVRVEGASGSQLKYLNLATSPMELQGVS